MIDQSGTPWLLSEHVEGTALSEYLERYGPLPRRRGAQLAADLLEAYEAYAPTGLIHRNIKPSNVIMAGDGRAVLTDFAPPIHPIASFSFSPAARGERLQQFEHLAPERLRGHDAPTGDLYAIGSVVYRALHGVSPLRRETEAGALRALIDAASPPWPEHADALTPLLLGLLDPDFTTRINLGRAKELLAWAQAVTSAEPQDAVAVTVAVRGAEVPADAAPQDTEPRDTEPRDAVPPGFFPRAAPVHSILIQKYGIGRLAFTPDGSELIAAAGPAEIHCLRLTNEPTFKPVTSLSTTPPSRSLRAPLRRAAATSLAYGAGGRLIASGGPDNRVRAWRPQRNPVRPAMELDGFAGPVTALAVDPTSVFLAAADHEDVWLCEPASGARRKLDVPVWDARALAFAPDGGLLAVAGRAQICLVETWTGTTVDVFRTGGPVDCLAFSPDGRILAASVPRDAVHLYHAGSWAVWQRLEFGPERVGALAFTRDGRLVGATAEGCFLKLRTWRL